MKFNLLLLSLLIPMMGFAYNISGKVLNENTNKGVEFATLWIEGSGIGTVTDEKGEFVINHLSKGSYAITIRCLGYAEKKVEINIHKDINTVLYLSEVSLALNEVTVTAERKTSDAATAYTLNRTALDHLQSISVSDALSLLPGEQTRKYKTLTSSKQVITLRGETLEMGNPDFGTVIEMDGVRVGGNATAESTGGTDLRNIGNNNVERIDIITGVPSVEYGDLTNGVVRIITRKGKTPFLADVSVRPNTQSYSIAKGMDIGGKWGILNLSYEHVRSVSDIASPYTSYIRNAFGAKYSNVFHSASGRNLAMDFILNGNLGGLNSETDPDAFRETYTKHSDNALWSSLAFNYMINSKWLANLRWGVTFAYADKMHEIKTNKSASSSIPSLHTTEEGYFVASRYEDNPSLPIILLPTGYWYVTSYHDDRPINTSVYAKAMWTHQIKGINGNLLLGSELKSDGNLGRGEYYADISVAPDWREYRYDKLPFMNNWASYIEEDLSITFKNSILNIKAGCRSDMTFISGSEYGRISSLSPRISARYSWGFSETGFLRGVTLRAGWGKAVKLPSFEVLYPRETYVDRLAFAPGTMADGTTYYAYHTHPVKPVYNPSLKWQYSLMREVGTDIRFKGMKLSLSFYYNSIMKPYSQTRFYSPFDYKLTDQSALEACLIPSADRIYDIDRNTGVVTVSDKTGKLPSQELKYKVVKDFQSASMSINGSSSSRMGVEWVVDFDKIKSINTSIRIDGKYYRYKGVDEVMVPSRVNLMSSDGQPHKYIGYYVGGTGNYNGFESRRLNTNLTFITHIPRLRMVFSLRFEGTFINVRRNLSEYSGGARSYVIDSRDDYLPSETDKDIYDGDNYVITYPLYYVSRDDMETKIPFMEKFLWAYENDKSLYNELAKLAVKSSAGYLFKRQSCSPYFSANLNVSKEIGRHFTVSFFANNFFYSMQKIKNGQTGNEMSLFDSGLLTPFNYGISFKLKL